jgi:hypothetical protein
MFGSGTLAFAEMDMRMLSTWEGKISRKIYGLVAEQGMWRIRTNQELK